MLPIIKTTCTSGWLQDGPLCNLEVLGFTNWTGLGFLFWGGVFLQLNAVLAETGCQFREYYVIHDPLVIYEGGDGK